MKNLRYLFVGNGRLSKHLQYYFRELHLPFLVWSRAEGISELYDRMELATHILLPISDQAIADFYKAHLENSSKTVVHFSGAFEFEGVHCAHPLMTFGYDLYEPDFYRGIPFITSSSLPFDQLLPGVPNSFYRINPKDKAYYHSLCVLGGNLTSLLVSKMRAGMKELGLPDEISKLYVEKSVENVYENPDRFFTGPLARKDFPTVLRNLSALKDDPYQKVYQSFIPITFPDFLEQTLEGENENPRL